MPVRDITRDIFQPAQRYTGARMQQGRVLTDDDFNAEAELAAEVRRRTVRDVVGDSGALGDGWRISNPSIAAGELDFDLEPGVIYVGGHRVELTETLSYSHQSDWVAQLASDRAEPAVDRTDLVYLEVWEQPVTATEDDELHEVALGARDTSTRTRIMARVRLLTTIESVDCEDAWDQLENELSDQGTLVGAELVPDLELEVTLSGGSDPENLCTPDVAGGYLGAENQALRVALHGGELVWGYDNSAPLYRVTVAADRKTVTLVTSPPDHHHWPVSGTVVEVLPWSAVLSNDEVLADQRGAIGVVATGYDPTTGEIELVDPLPPELLLPADALAEMSATHPDRATLEATPHVYLRVWGRGPDLSSPATEPLTAGPNQPLGTTGVSVKVQGTHLAAEAYWVLALRPETPNKVVPWVLESGKGPSGIRRFYAPLGLISWNLAGVHDVHDCRQTFRPLTRQKNCCTILVGDGDQSHGDTNSINDALGRLGPGGGQICLLPGTWVENVVIENKHRVTIRGCGDRSIIQPADPTAPTVTVTQSTYIDLLAFRAEGRERDVIRIGDENAKKTDAVQVRLADLRIVARDRCGIRGVSVANLTVENCVIGALALQDPVSFEDKRGVWPLVMVGGERLVLRGNLVRATRGSSQQHHAPGGIQLMGGTTLALVEENHVFSGIGNGITLGHVLWVVDPDDPDSVEVFIPGGFWTLGDCCPEADPTGGTDVVVDEAGNTLRPIPGPPLRDITIRNNSIEQMGMSGIGIARFWDMERARERILVRVLRIDANRIRLNAMLEQAVLDLDKRMVSAVGGIVLGAVERGWIRGNEITENGVAHQDPTCGVFVLDAMAVTIDHNHVHKNGREFDVRDPAAPGNRGGIRVFLARTDRGQYDNDDVLPTDDGLFALRVHDNNVLSLDGQALYVLARGPLSVQSNHLSTRGRSLIEALTGLMRAATGGAAPGTTSLSTALMDLLFTALGPSVFILDTGGSDLLDSLGDPAGPIDSETATRSDGIQSMQSSGTVLFHDNQVHLDLADPEVSLVAAANVVVTGGDLSVSSNQFTMEIVGDQWFTDGLFFGVTCRIIQNRFQESFDGNPLYLSAVSFGLLNNTSMNQSTLCLLPLGYDVVTTSNQNWIDTFLTTSERSGCDAIREAGKGILPGSLATTIP